MFQRFDRSGRVAVVVGGTSGIGRALARDLAGAGADVLVVDGGLLASGVNQ